MAYRRRKQYPSRRQPRRFAATKRYQYGKYAPKSRRRPRRNNDGPDRRRGAYVQRVSYPDQPAYVKPTSYERFSSDIYNGVSKRAASFVADQAFNLGLSAATAAAGYASTFIPDLGVANVFL